MRTAREVLLVWLLCTGMVATTATAQQRAGADSSNTIHLQIDLSASPARVYAALTDGATFAAFSGAPATIDSREGGAFSLFGDQITGRNVQLVASRRVVQAWRAEDWPEGAYSIVRFELTPQGSGTRLVFDHIGFAPGLHDHLVKGWEDHYWAPLKKYLK